MADRNGRQLGYAAAAAIEALPPPGTRFVYTGIVASGANLGTWAYRPWEDAKRVVSGRLEAALTHVELPRKEQPAVVESLTDATPDAVQEREKAPSPGSDSAESGLGRAKESSRGEPQTSSSSVSQSHRSSSAS